MTNYTKILLLSLAFIFIKTSTMAQSSITFDASQVFSNFRFTDSKGTLDKNYSSNISGSYNLGYRYSGTSGLLLRSSIGMRKAGATLVYDGSNYAWNLQYVDIKLGAGYLYDAGRFSPYLTASPYFSYLLKANQILNNSNYDIKKSNSIKDTDYGVFITPGVQTKVSENISAYAEFNYIMGLQNIETSSNGQKGYNRAYAVTVGVSISLSGKK